MAGKIQYQVGFKTNTNGLKQLKAALQDIQKLSAKDLMKINDSDLASAQKAFYQIRQEAQNVEKAITQAFNAKLNTMNIETFNKSLKSSQTSIQQVYKTFQQAGTVGENAFRKLSTQVLSTNIQLKESHNLLDKMATTLANTVKWQAASTVVNGMSRSIEQAWGYAKSLDNSLNDIRIVTSKSADEMGKFAQQANEAAQSLGKTTTDYTNAALIYAQQGLNDEEIQKRTQITLKTANVTGQSTDQVSEQLTAVWNGYKVNAEEAQLYVDRLAAVAATTASDLEELSTGMSKVASAASMMGVSEEQLAAQLSTIISATRQSPETIGTSLRTVFARISDIKAGLDEEGVTLGNYTGKMAELGFNVLDVNGNLRDMGQVLEEIGSKWTTLTREQQVNLAQTMAGQRQYSRLMALFDNFDKYQEALNTAQNAAGTLQEQQDIYMERTTAHLDTLKASMENIYDSLIDTDSINGLIDGLSTVANLVANFVDGIGGGGAVLQALGSIGLTVFSEQIAKGLNTTITNLQIASDNSRQFNAALQATREWQGIPGLDDVSRELLENRQHFLELSKMMTPEQFSGMQGLLNNIVELGNEIASLEQKKEPLEKIIHLVSSESLDETMGNGNLQDQITKQIEEQIQAYQELAEKIESVQNNFNKKEPNLNIGIKFEEAQVEVEKYMQKIQTLNEKGFFDQHENEIKKLKQEFSHLAQGADKGTKQAYDKYNDFFNKLKELFLNSGIELKDSLQQLSTEWSTPSITPALQQTKEEFNNTVQVVETGQARIERAISIEGWAKLAGGIGQVSSAIQQLQNLGNIFHNEDLTFGEKLLQIFTNIGFSLPMLVNGFNALKTSATALTVARSAGTAIETAHTKAIEEGTKAVSKAASAVQAYILGEEESFTISASDTGAKTVHTKAIQRQSQTYAKAASAVQAYILGEEESFTVSVADTGAKMAQAGATGFLAKAVDVLKTKIYELNAAMASNPVGAILMGAAIAITAIVTAIQKTDEARKEAIEANKELIETEKQNQEEIKKNEEFASGLVDIYQKEGQSKQELKDATEQLLEKYGLEQSAINGLTGSYEELKQKIKQYRLQQAEEQKASAERAFQAAKENVHNVAEGTTMDSNRYDYENNEFIAQLSQGIYDSSSNQIKEALKNNNVKIKEELSGPILVSETDQASIMEMYDNVKKTVQQLQNDPTFDPENSPFYTSLINWLESMKETADVYHEELESIAEAQVKIVALTSERDYTFEDIKDGNEYYKQRLELITDIKKRQSLDPESEEYIDKNLDPTELADSYLKQGFNNTYKQFNESVQFVDQLKEKFNLTKDEIGQIFSLMGKLDENQLSLLMELNPEDLHDWETLKNTIKQIAEMDLTHTTSALEMDFSSVQRSDAENYNKYQSIQNDVQSGKTISTETYDSIPELQQYFKITADGTYKMVGDAEEFYNKINSLKIDGFTQTLDTINQKIEQLNTIQQGNFNYDELTQNANQTTTALTEAGPTTVLTGQKDYDLVQNQLDYLAAVTDTNSVLGETVQIWQQLADKQQLTTDQVNRIAEEVKNAGDQTQNLTEQQAKYKEMAQETAHLIHDAMFPTDSDVDTEALSSLTGVLQSIAESEQDVQDSSKRLAKSLVEDSRAAEDVAEAILRFDDAIQDVVDNYDDWMDALQNGSMQDQAEVMDGLRDAYADLLDLDGSALSDQFLLNADNLNLMQAAINGDVDAYNQLMELAGQDILMGLGLDDEAALAKFQEDLAWLQSYDSAIFGNIADLEVGASLDDQAFLDELTNMVNAAGMTAQQATDYLASMGVDAEVIEQDTEANETSQNIEWENQITSTPVRRSNKVLSTEGKTPSAETVQTQVWEYNQTVKAKPVTETAKKENKSFALKVTSANKSSGGGFKFSQAKNGGGSAGTARRSSGGGGGGGSCFAAGTLVSVQNYYKNIEDVEIGDIVLSYNEKTKMNTYSEVVQTMIHSVKEGIYTLYIENEKLVVTGNHKLFITRNNKQEWLQVCELTTDDYVLFADGTLHKIEKIDIEVQAILVYNFEVSNTHNYYVGENRILAHNKGGGGSGGSSKADTSQKEQRKPVDDDRDRYHKVNIELQRINRNLERTQKIQEKTFGQKLIDNLNKQSKILDQHTDKLKEKNKIQKEHEAELREELSNLGAVFDEYGNIANYMDILKQKQDEINAYDEENRRPLIEQYNAQTDSDTKKQIAEQIDIVDDKLKQMQESYKHFVDKIKEYDDLQSAIEDLVDNITQNLQRQIEINIQKFRMEVEIRLEMGDAERDWNKFRREVLEHTEVLVDSTFDERNADTRQNYADAVSYLQVHGTKGQIEAKTDQLNATQRELDIIRNGGTSSIYGDDEAAALDHLKEDLSDLYNSMEDYYALVDDIHEAYLDTIDDVADNFDEQIEGFEFVGELIEHDMDLLTLLYGDKNYSAMNNYYTSLEQNNLKSVDALKKQGDFWKEQWEAALARGQTNTAKKFEENYKKAITDLNSLIESSAQNLRNKYVNAIEQIFDELDKKITNGMGSEYASMEWDLFNMNDDEYLDTINSAFSIQDVQAKYQKAIDGTSSIKSQRELNKLMEEQIGFLKDKEKLTQYDVDRAEKLLEVEQARIALEDAQAAKTSMRLKRDSQGNYSYEYVADDAATQNAAQDLATAQNNLYNFDKEAYQQNLNDQLTAWKEFQEQYKEILEDNSLLEEEREERLKLLREQYGEYINNKTEENYVIRSNFSESYYDSLMSMYENNLDNYSWMTEEEKETLLSDLEQSKNAYQESLNAQLDDFRAYREAYAEILNSDLSEEQKAQALNELKRQYEELAIGDFKAYREQYDAILNSDMTEEQKEAALFDLKRNYRILEFEDFSSYKDKKNAILNSDMTEEEKERKLHDLKKEYNVLQFQDFEDYRQKYNEIANNDLLSEDEKAQKIRELKAQYNDDQVRDLQKYRTDYDAILNSDQTEEEKAKSIKELQSRYQSLQLQDFEDYRRAYDATLRGDLTEEQKMALIDNLKQGYSKDELARAEDYQRRYKAILDDESLTEEQKQKAIDELKSGYSADQLARLENYRENYERISKGEQLTEEEKQLAIDVLRSHYSESQLADLDDYKKRYDDIANDNTLTEEQKQKAIKKLQDEATASAIVDINSVNNAAKSSAITREKYEKDASKVAIGAYTDSQKAYNKALDAQANKLNNEFLPTWNSGIQSMTDSMAGEGGFGPTTEKAFEDVDTATNNYKDSLDDLAEAAGLDLGQVKEGVDPLAQSFADATTDSDELTASMKNQLDVVQKLAAAVSNLSDEYYWVFNDANKAAEAIHEYIAALEAQNALAAQQERARMTTPETPATESKKEQSKPEPVKEQPKKEQPVAATPSKTSWDTVMQVYNLINTGQVSTGNQRFQLLKKKGYSDDEIDKGQEAINLAYAGTSFAEIKKILKLDTGGYTGEWGNSGKLAFLHQKELVLNQQDTKNLLDSVTILRSITASLGGMSMARLSGVRNDTVTAFGGGGLQQQVHIDASFPNVNSKLEIEEALSDLVNLAAQRALKF